MKIRLRQPRLVLAWSCLLAGICSVSPLCRAESAGSYRVEDETTLIEVAIRLYGDASMYELLAQWNHMEPPYALWKGRKLILEEPPKYDAKQGSALVLAYWRKHFGIRGEATAAAPAEKPSGRVQQAAPEPQQPQPEEDGGAPAASASTQGRLEESVDLSADRIQARKAFDAGEKLMSTKSYGEALTQFETARQKDPEFLPAWFYEIRTLRLLKRGDEAKARADELLKLKPQLKNLPVFREAAGAADSG